MADFSGLWLCTEVENFENFAEKLGISWMMKKVASATGWGKGVKKIAFKMEPGGKQVSVEGFCSGSGCSMIVGVLGAAEPPRRGL